jgi:hypothetical protein
MIDVPVSWGELLDKMTILEIKSLRIADPSKLANVRRELDLLLERRLEGAHSPAIEALVHKLRGVNEELWEIEDRIRDCERAGDFGPVFVSLARSVYRTNDRRAELKRAINERMGSGIVEEKSYAAY